MEHSDPYMNEKEQIAHLIIENSPAILFRRLASDDPQLRKMVYVSPNISRFGYQAKDFLEDKMMFRDIVYPEDSERTLREIKGFVREKIETYTQFYRIVTNHGEIRWVEDRTSIFVDEKNGVRYHQGIVIDIHDRKIAEDKLRESEEKYRKMAGTMSEALLLAGEVQRGLLPDKSPIVSGLDIAGRNIPCDEVGGDYFDFLWDDKNPESRFSTALGDITGHGVASALLMSSARAFLRMKASQTDDMVDIITDMNRHMTKDAFDTGRFMTFFFLSIEKNRSDIEWVRAGHDPALLYDPESDQFEPLEGPGLALGVDEEFVYQRQCKSRIKKGQLIVLGTDGIWEGFNSLGEMYGKNRLKDIIRKTASSSAETILAAIFQTHADFTSGMKPEDDTTVVVIKFV